MMDDVMRMLEKKMAAWKALEEIADNRLRTCICKCRRDDERVRRIIEKARQLGLVVKEETVGWSVATILLDDGEEWLVDYTGRVLRYHSNCGWLPTFYHP